MNVMQSAGASAKPAQVSDEEWQARIDLAAGYRLVDHFGWTDLILNHISLRVPGTADQFLVNPYGLLYSRVTASNLVKIDTEGNILEDTPYRVNRAGFVIHSAIHKAREDVHCVLHTHTVSGMAVSALACGLLPISQTALRFHGRIGYHDFEGIATDIGERERLVRDLGPHNAMILRHHGLLTAGPTVAQAFNLMHALEKSCESQMMVLASNQPYTLPSQESQERVVAQTGRSGSADKFLWPALIDLCDQLYPDFRS